jgi:hypothetical protein
VKNSLRIAWIGTLAAILLPVAAAARANPFEMDAFVLDPPAAAAPAGGWRYAQSYGYLWVPDADSSMSEAEWAPWDPWWALPYGRWVWADGIGWGWTPVIPPSSMSPLGWGWDGWYGGWYGFLPNGWPANTLGSFGTTLYEDTLRAQAWVNRHPHGAPAERKRPQVVAVVAAPPPSMALMPPMRGARDRNDLGQGRGPAGYEPPSRAHPQGGHSRSEPAQKGQERARDRSSGGVPNSRGGGGQAVHVPSGGMGGGMSAGPRPGGSGGQGKPHR